MLKSLERLAGAPREQSWDEEISEEARRQYGEQPDEEIIINAELGIFPVDEED